MALWIWTPGLHGCQRVREAAVRCPVPRVNAASSGGMMGSSQGSPQFHILLKGLVFGEIF